LIIGSIGLTFVLLFFNVCCDFFDVNERVREIRERSFDNEDEDGHFSVLFEGMFQSYSKIENVMK
jgi:hypothetical protein